MPAVIIVVVVLFLLNVGSDTLKQVSAMEQVLTEQAKVCLAEFSKKSCDSLKLTDDCRRLLHCVQKEDSSIIDRISHYLEVFIGEILHDYEFPSVLAMILLLYQLIQTIK